MSEFTHLSVVLLILVLLTLCAVIGTFVSSPVMAIFAIVFLLASCLVVAELRNLR